MSILINKLLTGVTQNPLYVIPAQAGICKYGEVIIIKKEAILVICHLLKQLARHIPACGMT